MPVYKKCQCPGYPELGEGDLGSFFSISVSLARRVVWDPALDTAIIGLVFSSPSGMT